MINPLIYTTCKIYTYFMRSMQDIRSSNFAIIQWTQLYYSYFDWDFSKFVEAYSKHVVWSNISLFRTNPVDGME